MERENTPSQKPEEQKKDLPEETSTARMTMTERRRNNMAAPAERENGMSLTMDPWTTTHNDEGATVAPNPYWLARILLTDRTMKIYKNIKQTT